MQSRKACMRTWRHHFLHENNVYENSEENQELKTFELDSTAKERQLTERLFLVYTK